MHAPNNYRILSTSSSIWICFIIPHVDMQTYDLFLMFVISMCIFHNSSPHINTKVSFLYL
jgi:hypothetical protein